MDPFAPQPNEDGSLSLDEARLQATLYAHRLPPWDDNVDQVVDLIDTLFEFVVKNPNGIPPSQEGK